MTDLFSRIDAMPQDQFTAAVLLAVIIILILCRRS